MWKLIAFNVVLFFLISCSDRDAHYESVVSKNGNERLIEFEKLEVDERMRVYRKIYENSGHPHDSELSIGFRDYPDEVMRLIIIDLNNSDIREFYMYLPVLYDIGKRANFDICEKNYIDPIRSAIVSYNLSSDHLRLFQQIKFDKCNLVM